MELIDHEALDCRLEPFPFPSDERKQIVGPTDLTRGQAKTLGRLMKVNEEMNDDDDDFFALVFAYWATLEATDWNLGRNGEKLPLTAQTLESELSKGDFAALAIAVTKHLYPYMFEAGAGGDAGSPASEDDMDGLEAEDGSQAETVTETPDPNA